MTALWTARAIPAPMGVEVFDFDAAKALDDATFARLVKLADAHIAVVIRNQHTLKPEDLIRFTARFGQPHPMHIAQFRMAEHPEVWVISNLIEKGKPIGQKLAGMMWHTDEMYLERPCSYTFLYGREVPPYGGDTLFANMVAAYEALPEHMKPELDRMRVVVSRVHGWKTYYPDRPDLTDEEKAKLPERTQPLVRVHPNTGRKALYCGGGEVAWNIEGMELLKGQGLLRNLREFATMPRFVYTHEWRQGDLVFWDNRCSLHSATLFDTERHRRLMWRTDVYGEVPIPADRDATAAA